MSDDALPDVLTLTATINSARIGNNQVAAEELPSLIQAVYQSLSNVGDIEPEPKVRAPALPWNKSVFRNFIVDLEDGRVIGHLVAAITLGSRHWVEHEYG